MIDHQELLQVVETLAAEDETLGLAVKQHLTSMADNQAD